jgi:hypothetical protein
MAATKKSSAEKSSSKRSGSKKSSAKPQAIHTESTATFLAFAEPPFGASADDVARACAAQGLQDIGIQGPFSDDDIIDFGAMTGQQCDDLDESIQSCVDGKGFNLPPLGATFDVLRQKGIKLKFANFVKAISAQMTPNA